MTREQINWEVEAIERCSAIAKQTIFNKEVLNDVLNKHQEDINELRKKL